MKRQVYKFLVLAILPALYWNPPALRFNIVDAAEPVTPTSIGASQR